MHPLGMFTLRSPSSGQTYHPVCLEENRFFSYCRKKNSDSALNSFFWPLGNKNISEREGRVTKPAVTGLNGCDGISQRGQGRHLYRLKKKNKSLVTVILKYTFRYNLADIMAENQFRSDQIVTESLLPIWHRKFCGWNYQ